MWTVDCDVLSADHVMVAIIAKKRFELDGDNQYHVITHSKGNKAWPLLGGQFSHSRMLMVKLFMVLVYYNTTFPAKRKKSTRKQEEEYQLPLLPHSKKYSPSDKRSTERKNSIAGLQRCIQYDRRTNWSKVSRVIAPIPETSV